MQAEFPATCIPYVTTFWISQCAAAFPTNITALYSACKSSVISTLSASYRSAFRDAIMLSDHTAVAATIISTIFKTF